MTHFRNLVLALVLGVALIFGSVQAQASTAAETDHDARVALQKLYKHNSTAAAIAAKAKAVLIFPSIIKGGFILGGSVGDGELILGNTTEAYYRSASASWGLQAGAQSYSYAVFLMNDSAVQYIRKTHGWEFGVGPTVVMVDEGVAKNLSTTTLKDDAYAFIFRQQGLMAGISLEGSKVTKITKN